MHVTRNRAIAAAVAGAIALTSTAFSPAMAVPVSKQSAVSQSTDFSAARRHRGYARGNAAAGAAILGIIGAVGAYAAAREYRRANEYQYGYGGCGPYGCGGTPYGYGGGPYYYR